MGVVKNVCSYSGHKILELAVSQDKIDGINFMHTYTNSEELKITLIIRWAWSKICITFEVMGV